MGNVIGIISSCSRSDLLMGLTKDRPISAVPFGSRYRLLDFPLSNMVNSGLRTVGVLTSDNLRSVLDHVKSGKEWSLSRKTGGLFILPGANNDQETMNKKFLLKDLALNMDFLKKSGADQVIISCSNLVININYREILKFHKNMDNDITFIYKEELLPGENGQLLFLDLEEDNRVKGFLKEVAIDQREKQNCFLDMFIIKRDVLIKTLEKYDSTKPMDLMEVLSNMLASLKVYAFKFEGYLGRIDSIKSYFDCNMDLLKPKILKELFMGINRIHTKVNDNPPSSYGLNADIRNSLVAGGCKIEGQVENSILFREVHIEQGAQVKNSIIMQKCYIGKDAVLENVILDKFVIIKDTTMIKGKGKFPIVIKKGAVVEPNGGVS